MDCLPSGRYGCRVSVLEEWGGCLHRSSKQCFKTYNKAAWTGLPISCKHFLLCLCAMKLLSPAWLSTLWTHLQPLSHPCSRLVPSLYPCTVPGSHNMHIEQLLALFISNPPVLLCTGDGAAKQHRVKPLQGFRPHCIPRSAWDTWEMFFMISHNSHPHALAEHRS